MSSVRHELADPHRHVAVGVEPLGVLRATMTKVHRAVGAADFPASSGLALILA